VLRSAIAVPSFVNGVLCDLWGGRLRPPSFSLLRYRERLSSKPNLHNLLKYVHAERRGKKSSRSATSLALSQAPQAKANTDNARTFNFVRHCEQVSLEPRPARRNEVEARVGFEPTNGGFADLSLGPLGYRAKRPSIANPAQVSGQRPTHSERFEAIFSRVQPPSRFSPRARNVPLLPAAWD
jgi:hypothetical protein